MEDKVLFNNEPVGYAKKEVDEYISSLIEQNTNLQQRLNDIKMDYATIKESKNSYDNQIEQLQQQINSLINNNRNLEYKLFHLNEQYQQVSANSTHIVQVLADAQQKASQIENNAVIKAQKQGEEYKKQILDSLARQSDVDQATINYYKIKRNTLILQQALLMLQEKVNATIDDVNQVCQQLEEL